MGGKIFDRAVLARLDPPPPSLHLPLISPGYFEDKNSLTFQKDAHQMRISLAVVCAISLVPAFAVPQPQNDVKGPGRL